MVYRMTHAIRNSGIPPRVTQLSQPALWRRLCCRSRTGSQPIGDLGLIIFTPPVRKELRLGLPPPLKLLCPHSTRRLRDACRYTEIGTAECDDSMHALHDAGSRVCPTEHGAKCRNRDLGSDAADTDAMEHGFVGGVHDTA